MRPIFGRNRDGDAVIIFCLAAILVLCGMWWGLPGEQVKRLAFGSDANVQQVVSRISGEVVQNSWEISKAENDPRKLSRDVFNSIRSFHPDEQTTLKSISNMRPAAGDFNPRFFLYPTFYFYLVAATLAVGKITGLLKITSDISFYFFHPGEMGKLYLAARLVTGLFSVLGIVLVYRIGRRMISRRAGILAATILAVTPLYLVNSHFATTDITMVFFVILTLYFCSLFWEKGGYGWIYAASAAAGLAASTKYPGVAVWLLIPGALLLRRTVSWKMFVLIVVTGFLVMTGAFVAGSPYAVLAFPEFKKDFLLVIGWMEVGAVRHFSPGVLAANVWNSFLTGFTGTLTMTFGAGILLYGVRHPKDRTWLLLFWGLLAVLLPYVTSVHFKYTRYFLPLTPFLALLTAYAADEMFRIVKRPAVVIPIVIFCLLLLPACLKSLAYDKLMMASDVRLTAARHINNNVPSGCTIAVIKDPWIFETPPVNPFRYRVNVLRGEDQLSSVKKGGYLLIGELQYFLTQGSRRQIETALMQRVEANGFDPVTVVRSGPEMFGIRFDTDRMMHDMLYTHPAIYLFRKR